MEYYRLRSKMVGVVYLTLSSGVYSSGSSALNQVTFGFGLPMTRQSRLEILLVETID